MPALRPRLACVFALLLPGCGSPHGGDAVDAHTVPPGTVDASEHGDDGGGAPAARGDLRWATQHTQRLPVIAGLGGGDLAVAFRGELTRRRTTDGSVEWTRAVDGNVASMEVIADGVLVATAGDGWSVVRYRGDGEVAWTKRFVSASLVAPAVAADGAIYLAGAFSDHAIFAAGDPDEVQLDEGYDGPEDQDDPHEALFVAKLGADGHLAWVRRATGDTRTMRAVILDDGVVVQGLVKDAEGGVLAPGTPDATPVSGQFFAAYSADGALRWARRLSDPSNDLAAAPGGFIAVSGGFGSPMELRRYDVSGTPTGTTTVTGLADHELSATLIRTHANGDVVIAGVFDGILTFPGLPELRSAGNGGDYLTGFVVRYDAAGTPLWARKQGGFGETRPSAIAALPDGTTALAGHILLGTVLGPGEAHEVTLDAANGPTFIALLEP